MVWGVMAKGTEAIGHRVSIIRKQWEMIAGSPVVFSFLFSPGSHPIESYLLQEQGGDGVFPPYLT